MRNEKNKPDEPKDDVPGWIVSFTDMVTLLLAFFVLLQAFAKERDPELFLVGQGSFRRAIAGLGMPDILLGKDFRPSRDYPQRRHPMDEDVDEMNRSRVLDAEDERIRKLFEDLRRQTQTETDNVRHRIETVLPTPLRFAPGSAALDEQARAYLRRQAADVRQNHSSGHFKLYVVGLASDESTRKAQWVLSARRARAAAEVLRGSLRSSGANLEVLDWGAGAGGQWCRRAGVDPGQSEIVIAVVSAEPKHGRTE